MLNLADDNIWYLETELAPEPEISLVGASGVQAFWQDSLTTLHERLGNVQQHGGRNVWINRVYKSGVLMLIPRTLGVLITTAIR